MDFIDLKSQLARIRPQIQDRINKVLDSGQFILGPEVSELEKALADFVGVRHCISCANGTDALQIALMALGIEPGDEVITPSFTFIANAEMIAVLGARPVFVDIDPRTYNIDSSKIEAAITKKTKAIMPVGLYGQCADMDTISAIAKRHGIPVIEDAAQSFGAEYKGRKSCSLSAIGATSFFPSKPLGCYGDGGALFTNDDQLAEKMKLIRSHGQKTRYNHVILGLNSRMDTLQAAVLIEKLKIFPEEIQARVKIGNRYSQKIKEATNCSITVPHVEDSNLSVYAQYTVRSPNRKNLVDRLSEAGIPTSVHYPTPIHLQEAFKYLGYKLGDLPHSEKAAQEVLSLPMHPYLSQADQDRVVATIQQSL